MAQLYFLPVHLFNNFVEFFMKLNVAFFTAIICLAAISTQALAQHDTPQFSKPKSELVWHSGPNVQVCEAEEADQENTCLDGRMPIGLAKVNKVIVGNYVESAKASWLALTPTNAALCYFGSNKLSVRCLLIDVPKDFATLDIDGAGDILFIARKGRADSASTAYPAAEQFASAVQETAIELQQDAVENDVAPIGRLSLGMRMGGSQKPCTYERWRRAMCDDEEPPEEVMQKVEIIGQRPSNCTSGGVWVCNVGSGGLDLAWASQKGFYVHQNAARAMIGPTLSKEEIDTLARTQVAADAKQYQDAKSTHRHAMRREGQSVEQANAEANDFVRKQFERAFNAPTRTDALYEFGMALHTLQDSTSPSHSGFQLWTGQEGLRDTMNHVRPELTNPGSGSHLYEATREAWKWFLEKNVPPGDLFRFGCDGCKVTGQG